MYSVFDYGRMMADEGRTRAYAECLKRYVTPSSVVVEIGTGTGILSLLAGRLGARKVYAIEADGALELARRVAAHNGLDGRIEFVQGMSAAIQLPERADILVAEIHGILPAHARSLASIIDARDRFLVPGGRLIPCRETLWAALVRHPALHEQIVGVWGNDVFGIDMTPVRSTAVNMWQKSRLDPGDLVATPRQWAVLDYASLQSPHVRGEVAWEMQAPCTAHGIGAWFDWEGGDGTVFSNSPLSGERHIFGQAFFAWPEPLELSRGDGIRIELRCDAVGSHYVYGWNTTVCDRDGHQKASFRQSDFFGVIVSPDRLHKSSSPSIRSEPCSTA